MSLNISESEYEMERDRDESDVAELEDWEFVDGSSLAVPANGSACGPGGNGQNGTSGKSPVLPPSAEHISCDSDSCEDKRKINDLRSEKMHCDSKVIALGSPTLRTLTDCRNRNNGDNIEVEYTLPNWPLYRFMSSWNFKDGIGNTNYGINQSRKNGTDGANIRGIQEPDAASIIQRPAKMIEYSSFLRESLNDHFKKFRIEFLYQLDSNKSIKKVYDTLELANDLDCLEERRENLNDNKDIELVYFNQSLLHTISEYLQNPKDVENFSQYKKVDPATLGWINILKYKSDSTFIVDISQYLDIVKRDMDRKIHSIGAGGCAIGDFKISRTMVEDHDRAIETHNQVIIEDDEEEDTVLSRTKVVCESVLPRKEEDLTSINMKNYPTASSNSFNEYGNQSESHFHNGQRYRHIVQVTQVPEVDCSIVLFDLIARSVTGKKYKSAKDESLLSPMELIARRITNGLVQSEYDIERNFNGLLSKLEVRENSWFGKMKGFVKSTYKFVGFFREENI